LKRFIFHILVLAGLVGLVFSSCRDDNFMASNNAKLAFSVDTLMFDTIFTTIGSTTKSFRVINPNNHSVLISSIYLAGGSESAYRLNIDGEMTNEMKNLELPARDSIYIFVEITVDPNGVNQPMIVQDSVVFSVGSRKQDVDLLAWGQDFVPINNQLLETTTWTAEKPYLVYNIALVDTGHVLTIEPGTRVYFHKNAQLIAIGAINAVGNAENPILFASDRLELMYEDIPDQWGRILLLPGGLENRFEHANIRNSVIGLQVGALEYEGVASVVLHNVKLQHISYAGILAFGSKIQATNTLISNCGYYGAALVLGGSYEFNHCTVVNYWNGFSNRKTPSVYVSNRYRLNIKGVPDSITNRPYLKLAGDTVEFFSDLEQSNWKNSIIWGSLESEIDFDFNKNYLSNSTYENTLFKLNDSTNNIHSERFLYSIRNQDPLFINNREYDFRLDSVSPAINKGNIDFSRLVPTDLNGVSRLADVAPDLGVYEWISIENE
jgi:hypothetical protein